MSYNIPTLPLTIELETVPVLKKVASAHRYLAELKGISHSIPNQSILVNTLSLQEAKDSSAIENIITTHDELFREELFPEYASNASAKEVKNYVTALKRGFDLVQQSSLLTNNHILAIQAALENNRAGFRKLPGTELKNDLTGEIVYTPPQSHDEILRLMSNLERFINDDAMSTLDPLIKMAIIHHQFESIHPFYDGNGRTGRIINVLYLVAKGLLDIPVLYLSRYIVCNKADYYQKLQNVRQNGEWEPWVLYMLDSVETTSRQTITIVQEIGTAINQYRDGIRESCKFYSQDLINNLFYHPYTKIEFLTKALNITRLTATKYLDALCAEGYLQKEKTGRSNYYINKALFGILTKPLLDSNT
jgi:Fic family protein